MNIRSRLQQLDKENIHKICSQMEIKHTEDNTKSELINKLLLPLQTYKMERTRSNTGKDKKTEVKSQKCYHKAEMEDLAKRLHNLNIKPYTPTKEQQKRILKLLKK